MVVLGGRVFLVSEVPLYSPLEGWRVLRAILHVVTCIINIHDRELRLLGVERRMPLE